MNWLHMKKQTECLNSWDQVSISPSTSNLLAKYFLNMLELTEKRKYGTSLNFFFFFYIPCVCWKYLYPSGKKKPFCFTKHAAA